MRNTYIGEIKKVLSQYQLFLKNKYKVKKVGVFGSAARGEQKEDSDLDILVEFYKPISFFEFVELEEFLGKILKKDVDLVTSNALKPAIKKQVLSQTVYV